jgi:uncharacterized protein (UPF0332 family)
VTKREIRAAIVEELTRSDETLREADVLQKNGLLHGAVSRLYYAVLHGVRALLLTEGLEPRSHDGALRLLGLHFVKTGVLTPQESHVFARLMKFREQADYNASYVFTPPDVKEFRTQAGALLEKLRAVIGAKGLLPPVRKG